MRQAAHHATMIQRIIPAPSDTNHPWPLHGVAASRMLEQRAAAQLPPHTLMARAGLAIARLAFAIAPDARTCWIACGPGNNGGDGLEAAVHLHRWSQGTGKRVVVTWLGDPSSCPADSRHAWTLFEQAGLQLSTDAPAEFDIAIDALLGIGSARAPDGRMQAWIKHMNASTGPVLAIDLPTGLNADTGALLADPERCVRATHTLGLLSLKPGLFTAHGREQSGDIWFDDLQVDARAATPNALLGPSANSTSSLPQHAAHKGSFGDVCVIGGDTGMTGAALLAAGAALRSGCGRVYLGLLDACMQVNESQPDLMFRAVDALDLRNSTVVCGCGAGTAVAQVLPRVLSQAPRLVLDADALNAIAVDTSLQALLAARSTRGWQTILTPHPLEAARLLGICTADVQADRIQHAQQLAERHRSIVVLKGSGTVIAAPGAQPAINLSGNAKLAIAGTGDLLAGMLGGAWSRVANTCHTMAQVQALTVAQVYLHGRLAEICSSHRPSASDLMLCLSAVSR